MSRARGLTLIEVVVSMGVAATMLAASLYAAAASRATMVRWHDRAVAGSLADDLLGFVCERAYASDSGSLLGLELDDVLGNKLSYDDVDDFDGWTESPPTDADGVALPGLSGWTRGVSVRRVMASDPSSAAGLDEGVKEVVVWVRKGGVELARRVGLKTDLADAWR